ncbi:MAG: HAMP domain-containing protein [Deltaproteobacteria bacterium]|nr:MAG: HAMP domain-containing protein [Deltaproteobacteria bacterium]TNF28527.1 MAG: HAMP domain-containing protein [Deltaproteobacteria bacterium]
MNLSLRSRVTTSFIVANLVVLVLSFTVFHHLNSLNKEIEKITLKSNKVSLLTDSIRITAVSLLRNQRKILTQSSNRQNIKKELVDKILNLCDSFTSELQTLDSLYRDPDVKKVIAQMLSYVDSLRVILSKTSLFHRDTLGMQSIEELADKILDSFTEFQDLQYFQSEERDRKIKQIIKETKRNMMITLIIGFLGTIVLGLVVPGKIALPFKKIKDAIRELQDCNFDVSIYYSQDDEIGEIAREMNKMIQSFKVFEELRADKIHVEVRKFDALANLVKKPILVANAEGKLIYINNRMYDILQVQSEDVINKEMTETLVPKNIIESYELAIKRRSKIDNQEVVIPLKKHESEDDDEHDDDDDTPVKSEIGEMLTKEMGKKNGEAIEGEVVDDDDEEEVAFRGYATVIPIRGKESSLDYYLMVLSSEVFT